MGSASSPPIEMNGQLSPCHCSFVRIKGHSCFAHSIERMYAPCEFGMARCQGHLLHESTLGEGVVKFPNRLSGLRKALDYGLLRFIPTRCEFPVEYAAHVPHWLSQRKGGEAPPAR
eukprot:144595-Pyramimonas_sp.AAC.1